MPSRRTEDKPITDPAPQTRHYPRTWGAEPVEDGRWRFAIWAPQASHAALALPGREGMMTIASDGFWRTIVPAHAGERYTFVIDGLAVPDPAARAQAGDVHGPSRLIDPRGYAWRTEWQGRPWHETVLYEIHIGTFTPEGTFDAARSVLPYLADLGITAIELMPVAQFGGDRGWGYDAVLPYAPHPAYGTPDALRRFVERAQELGMSVLLDVVYSHFGPEGNYVAAYAPGFFDTERETPWGAAFACARPAVRRFFIDNALYWLEEFRFDGLRLDAIDQIEGGRHDLLGEIAAAVRGHGFERPIHLTTEDERNITHLHGPGAASYDAEWNDDYHHCIHCLLTGEDVGVYRRFAVDPIDDLGRALAEGFVEQGQARPFRQSPRGEPSGMLDWPTFINFNQNHDQTGNRALGERLISLARDEPAGVAHALLLLAPFTPLLFMGEEAGETAPFRYFTDFGGELALAVREGRMAAFARAPGFGGVVPDPNAPQTFEMSRLSWSDDARSAGWRDLTRRLLALRAGHVVPLLASGRAGSAQLEARGERSLLARWPFEAGTLTIAVNLGAPPHGAFGIEAPLFTINDIDRASWAIAMRTDANPGGAPDAA